MPSKETNKYSQHENSNNSILINKYFKNGLSFSKDLKVAYQGSLGSFSEIVLINFFGEHTKKIAFENFGDAYKAILNGECDLGILPLENTLIGTIHPSFDLLSSMKDLTIIADELLRIEHTLIGFEDTDLNDITTVFSQWPGLEQCTEFLNKYPNWERIPFKDTAAAAQHVASQQNRKFVAIASERAAQIYKLKALKKNIETNPHNFTRFVIVSNKHSAIYKQWFELINKEKLPNNVGFCVFTTEDKPGALLRCLRIFESNNVNLHKIESRPIIGKPWEYQFTVELDLTRGKLDQTLIDLEKISRETHVIGIYHRLEKKQSI